MNAGPKLTPAACRAGRALLHWSMAKLGEEAGLGLAIVSRVEHGGPISAAAHGRIVGAFERAGVRISRDGAGARLVSTGKRT